MSESRNSRYQKSWDTKQESLFILLLAFRRSLTVKLKLGISVMTLLAATEAPVLAQSVVLNSQKVVLDVNGPPFDPGDVLVYTITVQNVSAFAAQDVLLTDVVDLNSSLDCVLPGDPTTDQGTVSICDDVDGLFQVTIGTITAGQTVTMTASVTVSGAIPPASTNICNQGLVSGTNFADQLTDDPVTPLAGDATCLFDLTPVELISFRVD
jgi:uncharacterized repeat protein (TIGR01451 family)